MNTVQIQHLRTSELDASFQRALNSVQRVSPGTAIGYKPGFREQPASPVQLGGAKRLYVQLLSITSGETSML